jgi:peroxiredoxin Q/BCP
VLRVGDVAPGFELADHTGARVRLSDVLDRGPVVVYFYPADFTPVCTREACMFKDAHAELAARGVQVLGISPQDPASHAKFRDAHELPFPLLCDPEWTTIKAWGARGPLGLVVRRITYVVGRDGKVQDAVEALLRLGKHQELVSRLLLAASG